MSDGALIPNVLVPRSVIADSETFGGSVVKDGVTGDLLLRNGRAIALRPSEAAPERILLPRLTDPHVHLDKCHSVDRMDNVGGDLAAALAAQRADKAHWTVDDLRARAGRGLSELMAAGCGLVRSHVDWGDDSIPDEVPLAWEVLGDLATDAGSELTLQRAALVNVHLLADPDYARRCAARIARDGGVLGTFVLDQPQRRAGVQNAFREASRLGIALDFHVDEGLQAGLHGVEMIADIALETGFDGPILCGHACALSTLPEDDVARIADKLARAGIAVAALPQTNLYLQGRRGGTPDLRGLTRVHELRAAGVNVVLGADNVRDAFCPIGQHVPLVTLGLGVLSAHLDPPFADHLPMISTDAARALGQAPLYVDQARIGALIVFEARSISDLVANAPAPRPLAELTGEEE
ncbi:amidohydrolase family protein [Marimonas sp. MJW-29]|uniref:Amidohydrolase family protein n=1 Tax=Sulfitobacter sediminis TaxID=3234186 RepID=A0ABV3RMB1_9RHOB